MKGSDFVLESQNSIHIFEVEWWRGRLARCLAACDICCSPFEFSLAFFLIFQRGGTKTVILQPLATEDRLTIKGWTTLFWAEPIWKGDKNKGQLHCLWHRFGPHSKCNNKVADQPQLVVHPRIALDSIFWVRKTHSKSERWYAQLTYI